jgi:hypothetical protein
MKKAMAASAIAQHSSKHSPVMRKIRSLLMGVLGLPVQTVGFPSC